MVIHRNDWSVGSLSSTDPNAHSFHSPNWRHSGEKRSSAQEVVVVEDDVVSISSHPPYHRQNSSTNLGLVNAVSFGQTQDGFLEKVQEALQRMGELSLLAQKESNTETERLNYTVEFAQLQNRIKEIEKKMFKAITLFQAARLETGLDLEAVTNETAIAASLHTIRVDEYLENTLNPELTTINSAKNASVAVDTIHSALEAVASLRAKVNVGLERLNSTDEQLSALDENPVRSDLQIRDGNGAEKSTRFVSHDILVKSGTAMLAQANAIPQSALRLLK